MKEQPAIASILGALDDKIDLNRRMNETLEAMARAIFKDWFVDFGPTRAKMEGRAPYLAPEIWALFPERLDDEGKPEGWAAFCWRGYSFNLVFESVTLHLDLTLLCTPTHRTSAAELTAAPLHRTRCLGKAPGKVTSGKLSPFKRRRLFPLFGKLRPYFFLQRRGGRARSKWDMPSTDIVVRLKSKRAPNASSFVLASISPKSDDFRSIHQTGLRMEPKCLGRAGGRMREKYPVVLPEIEALNQHMKGTHDLAS